MGANVGLEKFSMPRNGDSKTSLKIAYIALRFTRHTWTFTKRELAPGLTRHREIHSFEWWRRQDWKDNLLCRWVQQQLKGAENLTLSFTMGVGYRVRPQPAIALRVSRLVEEVLGELQGPSKILHWLTIMGTLPPPPPSPSFPTPSPKSIYCTYNLYSRATTRPSAFLEAQRFGSLNRIDKYS
jgi:hypothetical protein